MESKCPICDNLLIERYKSSIEGTLCELVEECLQGHYSYEYSYGAYREKIGNVVFTYSEDESKIAREQQRNTIIIDLRMKWKYDSTNSNT